MKCNTKHIHMFEIRLEKWLVREIRILLVNSTATGLKNNIFEMRGGKKPTHISWIAQAKITIALVHTHQICNSEKKKVLSCNFCLFVWFFFVRRHVFASIFLFAVQTRLFQMSSGAKTKSRSFAWQRKRKGTGGRARE